MQIPISLTSLLGLDLFWLVYKPEGQSRGGSRGTIRAIAPIKPKKVTLITTVLYNPENNIRDIRSFCRPLLCHSSVVKYTVLHLSYSSEHVVSLDYQILLKSPPLTLLAGSAPESKVIC